MISQYQGEISMCDEWIDREEEFNALDIDDDYIYEDDDK